MGDSINDLIAKQKAAAKSLGVSIPETNNKTQVEHTKSDAPKKSLTPKSDHPKESLIDEKLDRIYDVLNHIRWMILGFLLVTFVVPFIIYNVLK
jgi:hypothetical protein